MSLPPVRPVTLDEIKAARERTKSVVLRTPLVKLDTGKGGPDIRLKLENLQPTNAYKIRGAVNAVAMLSDEAKRRGVWTISAGNAGQGVAYAARAAGVPCKVVVIDSAPQAKVDRMRALGAELIPTPFSVCWRALEEHAFPGMDGTLVHPFDDHNFIAGHAAIGLEILEDEPNTKTIIAAIGGGGLITAIGSAIKAVKPDVRILGAEPETAAPFARSWAANAPRDFPERETTFVDGAGGSSIIPRMWERMRPVTDGALAVTLDETRQAMKLMAEKARVISEGAGALPVAAALSGKAGDGPIVAVVSGGNLDMKKFSELIAI
ncbi:MAG: threonine/serine dehydratase [Vitreimonas sp.]